MEMVSVIVPIYNKEKYLNRCIDSLLRQTYSNIEILLINDGSTDNCELICKSYKDKRIKYYYKKNGGVSSARNYGMSKVKSDYIIFVDADDFVDEDYIEKLYNSDYDFIMCSYRTVLENDNVIDEYSSNCKLDDKRDILNTLFDYNYIRLLAVPYLKFFKKNIIEKYNIKFNEKLSYGEDTCFVVDYLNCCDNALVINYKGYNNVVSQEDSLSRKYIKDLEIQFEVLNNKIYNLSLLNSCRKSLWYFRNFKNILFNDSVCNYKTFHNSLKRIRNNFYFKLIKTKDLCLKDIILYFLIKIKMDYIIYLLYNLKK